MLSHAGYNISTTYVPPAIWQTGAVSDVKKALSRGDSLGGHDAYLLNPGSIGDMVELGALADLSQLVQSRLSDELVQLECRDSFCQYYVPYHGITYI